LDIFKIPVCFNHVSRRRQEKRGEQNRGSKNGTLLVPVRFCCEGSAAVPTAEAEERTMSLGTIILIILVIALLGGFSGIGGGPFYGTGYYGGGGLGLVIVILLILLLLGRI
jgi:hypothetical protein